MTNTNQNRECNLVNLSRRLPFAYLSFTFITRINNNARDLVTIFILMIFP